MKDINTKNYKQISAIYCIKNIINENVYIGSTTNLYRRLIHHRAMLLQNKHSNSHLQKAFNKYGLENFKIEILELCEKDKKQLCIKECNYCKQYDKLYNLKTIEELSFGFTRTISPESRKKQSLKLKGKIPKNLKDIQQQRRRKIKKIMNEKIVEIFNSCTEAAKSLNMTTNLFTLYIGKKLDKKPSKYFPKNVRYEYYE